MSNTKILIKNSTISGSTPPDLELGELAINVVDKRLFFKLTDGSFRTVSPSDFKTVNGESVTGEISVVGFPQLEPLANTSHTHQTAEFTQTNRFFLTPTLVSQMDANEADLNTNEQAIQILEENSVHPTLEYKAKYESNSEPVFLDDIFGLNTEINTELVIEPSFGKNADGKLFVLSIQGVVTTIDEFNYLDGTTLNVQTLLNQLKDSGDFTTPVQSFSDLETLVGTDASLIIVISDETNSNATSIYRWEDGIGDGQWVHVISFTGQTRDFKLEPINLQTEAKGKISRDLFPAQTADQTPIIDISNFIIGVNVETALAELALLVK